MCPIQLRSSVERKQSRGQLTINDSLEIDIETINI